VARAAYRYHHSCGVRFSTYAANWIRKEVQRQSLDCRLIKISANTIEQFSLGRKNNDTESVEQYSQIIKNCSCIQDGTSALDDCAPYSQKMISEQEAFIEEKELNQSIRKAINTSLSTKESDIIKRRFGLPPYTNTPQSIIEISKVYGVTRSRIYQLESKALKTLQKNLNPSMAHV
jgi:RNA polymerase primary sigma factor